VNRTVNNKTKYGTAQQYKFIAIRKGGIDGNNQLRGVE
jgi:hypothetical protein